MGEVEQRRKHAFHVLHDVGVGEADDVEALSAGDGILAGIGFGIMRVTVDLDDQGDGWAEEVGNAATKLGLSTELEAAELALGKVAPEADFRFGRVAT